MNQTLPLHRRMYLRMLFIVHQYPDITIHLTLFNCTIAEGVPQLLEHNALKWITPAEISQYDFCPADTEILDLIKEVYTYE